MQITGSVYMRATSCQVSHQLEMNNVQMIGSVNYKRIGDEGVLVSYGETRLDLAWIDVATKLDAKRAINRGIRVTTQV